MAHGSVKDLRLKTQDQLGDKNKYLGIPISQLEAKVKCVYVFHLKTTRAAPECCTITKATL